MFKHGDKVTVIISPTEKHDGVIDGDDVVFYDRIDKVKRRYVRWDGVDEYGFHIVARTLHKVTINTLKPGDRFKYNNITYAKIINTNTKPDECYAVIPDAFILTYQFAGSLR